MRQRANILLVDDRPENLVALEATLAPLGHNLVSATSGEEALRHLLTDDFAVILLDVQMPVMDGFACAEIIKARERTRRVPIVFLTANTLEQGFLTRAYDVGAVDYLAKPLDPIVLSAKVRAFVDLHLTTVALKERKKALRASEALHRTMVGNLPDAFVLLWGSDGVCQIADGPALETVGWTADALVGRTVCQALPASHAEVLDPLVSGALAGRPHAFDWPNLRSDREFSAHVTPVYDDRELLLGAMLVARDTTQQKRAEAELADRAMHDSLTRLPSRSLLMDRLTLALSRVARSDRPCAVLFVDLDRFKFVNDSLGHAAGDQLLVEVAERLRLAVRPCDTVARLGGDEFVVLCEDLQDELDAVIIADRITESVARPFELLGSEAFVTASVGIKVTSEGDADAGGLIRDADAAMYQAKRHDKSCVKIFDRGMRNRAAERLTLERELRRALDRNQLRLLYQPKIDIRTEALVGVEALVRWQHPEQGIVSPADFIPLAEETGLIIPIGRWVLQEACRQAQRWRKDHGASGSLGMSVNLSARQIGHPDLVETVRSTLDATGLPAELLDLEITEGTMMANLDASRRTLTELKAIGVSVSLDDFGTGYSSLSHLKRFPLDVLKVDRSFVSGLGTDADDTAIVEAIMALARALRLSTVAEGVETDDQLQELRKLGCDVAQGYHFGRPESPDAIAERLYAVAGRSPAIVAA